MSGKVVRDISSSLRALSPGLHGVAAAAYRKALAAASAAGRWLGGVCVALWERFAALVGRVMAVSTLNKLYAALLSFFVFFIVWQFFAYAVEQTTFVVVNLMLALFLAVTVLRVSILMRADMQRSRSELAKVGADLERRDVELSKLKADLFELRNKGRRGAMAQKSARRLVEAVKKLRGVAAPADEPLQYVVDALVKTFDISGAVAFARGEGGLFSVAGRFALAADPPASAADGIVGQAVATGKPVTVRDVPTEYLTAVSGLGRSRSLNVYALPLVGGDDGEVVAVVEVASFAKLPVVAEWHEIEQQLREYI